MLCRLSAILPIFILFTACQTTEKVETPAPDEVKLNLIPPSFYATLKMKPASMYGVWAVKGTFMYSNVLEIKRDGTFNFLEGGCTGSRFTEGSWQGAGYSCALNSFDKYNVRTDNIYERDMPCYFNNIQLRLYGDTLYSFGENGFARYKYVMVEQY